MTPLEWSWSGATGPDHGSNKLALVGDSVGQFGTLWSNLPLLTDSFEIQFSFEVGDGVKPATYHTKGFGLWLSPQTIHDTHAAIPQAEDWSFFGHTNKFKGLGVIFSLFDRTGALNPSISAITNDGIRRWNHATDIPSSSGVYWRFQDGTDPMIFKLTVTPAKVHGQAKFESSTQWTDTFKIDTSLGQNLYLGLTADSGPPTAEFKLAEKVLIWNLVTSNLNLNFIGEELAPAIAEAIPQNVITNVLKSGSVEDTLRNLSLLITKLIYETVPQQLALARSIQNLEITVAHLIDDMSSLETHLGAPHAEHHAHLNTLTNEFSGLKNMIASQSQHQAKVSATLIEVGKSIKDGNSNAAAPVRELETIRDHLQKQTRMNWMLFGALGFTTVIIVAFVWKKSKEMEKKHLF